MKAMKFVLIYLKTVKAKKSTHGKKKIRENKVNTRLNQMNSRHNKENHGGKTNSAKFIGGRFGKSFYSLLCKSCGNL